MLDQQLLEPLTRKEATAFRKLVEKYRDPVFQTCLEVLKNLEEAEDITQDVFEEVYCSIHRFRGKANLYSWLYHIAVNKALDRLKKSATFFVSNRQILIRNLK